ncbi:hypothetical protein DNTS_001315 [Danionella cerebrum]|uniref:DOMON domain-containing protein n=1 Tax=Danionella cerebrum TaxID=2873325 RepID=A0A553Q3R1_9TELE|nr:hypothetical protein DNTS_001315 [Danionella translucida]
MFVLHPLLRISVLLDATLWLTVSASPTDDNVLRASHGEHGEPGHEESHKDSYSTFASEFLESRYLSDEGIPGVPWYGKPGCDADTCDYFLSYRRIGTDVEYEMSADTDGWVAGGDDVMGCVHDDNGRVRIHHFYNVGQWAKEIKRNPARDEEGIFENNRVTCRFKRPLHVAREETLVDLHLSWYYLFAWGPAIQGSITRHDIDSPPVSDRMISIYKYEDIFMPATAYQTFSSPFCLLLIVALTFYLLMGTP